MWFAADWNDEWAEAAPGGLVVRDSAGDILRVTLGADGSDCRPGYVADPDDWIVKAIVAAEDGEFWSHCGVRPLSVLRAAWQNVSGRRRVSGASTISMQAVRLMKPHPKTLWHKAVEAVSAIKMERCHDKRWILSQYLDRAPFGGNLVGIEAAADGWFGRSARGLGLGEAAILAGMVQAPSRFRPDRHLDRALARRDYVLGRMLSLGMIDDMQMEAARSVVPVVRRTPRPFKAPHFCDWVVKTHGDGGKARGEIRTSLDPDIQRIAESAVVRPAEAGLSAAAVVMRTDDGGVLALACSGSYFDPGDGQVNTAASPRPAGSTLKPFLAALAMDRGIVAPDERLMDAPVSFKGYRPANFDSRYRGLVSLRDSLVLSLNTPFVQMLRRVGVRDFCDCLASLGFANAGGGGESAGLGVAIGGMDVSLLELVAAYRAVACGGNGVFSREASFVVSDMLSGSERAKAALGHVADVAIPRFAWKTGTSSAFRDAWTVMWNPQYVIGVWCGRKKGGFGDETVVGAKVAAPAAWTIARSLYPQGDGPWFDEPAGMERRRICSLTGLCAGVACQSCEEGRGIRGRTPFRVCEAHCASASAPLKILRPEEGAKFRIVPGVGRQKIVCQVSGNAGGGTLWWFVDGVPSGVTSGEAPLAVEMVVGRHEVVCAAASGESASVSFEVAE